MEILQYYPRQSGKTTRLIDVAIQKLFTFGQIKIPLNVNTKIENDFIIDEDAKTNNVAQQQFVHRLLERLKLEHRDSIVTEHKNSVITIKAVNQTDKIAMILNQETLFKNKNIKQYAKDNPTEEELKRFE